MSRKRTRQAGSEEDMSAKLLEVGGGGEGKNGSDTSFTSSSSQLPVEAESGGVSILSVISYTW